MPSAAIKLLDLVWASTNEAVSHSWERLNHAMRDALTMAVGAGFNFDVADFAHIAKEGGGRPYGFYRWVSESDEWIYRLAIVAGNMSAIRAYEEWKGRKAFFADSVDPGSDKSGYMHLTGNRKRERLAVSFKFSWRGVRVTVTSFADDQQSLTACSYRGQYGGKIDRRFRITRDDLAMERAERKAREKQPEPETAPA